MIKTGFIVEKTTPAVIVDKFFEPVPSVYVCGSYQEAECFFRDYVKKQLGYVHRTEDEDGNDIDECTEIGEAMLSDRKVSIWEVEHVRVGNTEGGEPVC